MSHSDAIMRREQPGIMKKKQQEVHQMRMEARLEELKTNRQTKKPTRNVSALKPQPIHHVAKNISETALMQTVARGDLSTLTYSQTNLSAVKQFLKSCGLEQYFDELTSNGIDDMEILLELSDSHLIGLNISLGHRIRLLKRIKEVRDSEIPKNSSVPQGLKSIEVSSKPFESNSDIFKQAIDQFRKGGSASQRVAVTESVISSSIDRRPSKQITRTRSLATSSISAAMVVENRCSCTQCYSLHLQAEALSFDGKDFCSQVCCDLFKAAQLTDCKCGKKFSKATGVLRLGIRHCSQVCASRAQEEPVDAFSGW
jgi:hypothetical protein